MRLKTVQTLSNQTELEELIRFVSQFQQDIVTLVNGNLSLIDNTRGGFADVTFAAANTDVQVPHRLSFVPNGYIPVSRSTNIQVFDGATSNTNQFLYVRSSGAGTARLYVF